MVNHTINDTVGHIINDLEDVMNNIWSEQVQGINTLYLSRKIRFDDCFAEQYRKVFKLDENANLKILEIGCGPGALAEALHRWYPNTQIVGSDRDTNFIEFAKKNVSGVKFVEGDITKLPFEDASFDVVISNTVQEHIEPNAFWGEQKRILKKGGICICLSARRGINCPADCLHETTEEKEFWDKVPNLRDKMLRLNVGQYWMNEAQIPQSMESHGFSNVTTGYAIIDMTPDDSKYTEEFAEQMIEAARHSDLEAIEQNQMPGSENIVDIVNRKYDKRLELFRSGIKQWDTSVAVTMILRGVSK